MGSAILIQINQTTLTAVYFSQLVVLYPCRVVEGQQSILHRNQEAVGVGNIAVEVDRCSLLTLVDGIAAVDA